MIAIALHLYYVDLWNYFREKLEKLNTKFDLYITLCEDNLDISGEILKSFPYAKIYNFPNKGQDIGPFLQLLKKIRNKDYDFLIKLHAKKTPFNPDKGKEWMDELVNCLISSDDVISKNISTLKGSFKMCGSEKWLFSSDGRRDPAKEYFENYQFIGGTMFMVDFKNYCDLLTDQLIDDLYEKMPLGYARDLSFTHEIERLLGKIIVDSNCQIKGV